MHGIKLRNKITRKELKVLQIMLGERFSSLIPKNFPRPLYTFEAVLILIILILPTCYLNIQTSFAKTDPPNEEFQDDEDYSTTLPKASPSGETNSQESRGGGLGGSIPGTFLGDSEIRYKNLHLNCISLRNPRKRDVTTITGILFLTSNPSEGYPWVAQGDISIRSQGVTRTRFFVGGYHTDNKSGQIDYTTGTSDSIVIIFNIKNPNASSKREWLKGSVVPEMFFDCRKSKY